jgi:type IV pilus assembly protein PilP
MKMKLLAILLPMLAVGLTGCESRIDEVNAKMQKIHAEPPKAIEAAPVFLPIPTFNYSAQQLRSPFMPPSLAQELKVMAGRHVMPDLSRPRQQLEAFPIESLRMRGSIRRPKGPLFGLIESPDGSVVRIQLGNYMGKNDGRVVGITPSQISVIEIVPDGRNGFVERPRSLVMVDVGA